MAPNTANTIVFWSVLLQNSVIMTTASYFPLVALTPIVKNPAAADGFATSPNVTFPSKPDNFGP